MQIHIFPSNQESYHVGEPIVFSGYEDNINGDIQAIEFSLDDGNTWSAFQTANTRPDKGINWNFEYVPQKAGNYVLKARAVGAKENDACIITSFAFRVHA